MSCAKETDRLRSATSALRGIANTFLDVNIVFFLIFKYKSELCGFGRVVLWWFTSLTFVKSIGRGYSHRRRNFRCRIQSKQCHFTPNEGIWHSFGGTCDTQGSDHLAIRATNRDGNAADAQAAFAVV